MPFKRRIGYIGWVGFGNLGDEIMFEAFKRLFCQFDVLPFKFTHKIELFEKIKKREMFQAVCQGGGTLINAKGYHEKYRIAQERYGKTFVFGTGVRNPIFWNRVKNWQDSLNEWLEILNKSIFVGVRGPISQQLLCERGFDKAEVIGDISLSLAKPGIIAKKRRKVIGINIGVSDSGQWGRDDDILEFIVKFANIMLSKKWNIKFMPVCEKDLLFIKTAARKIGRGVSVFNEYKSMRKIMQFFETCDLFVGEKMHSVILAMCSYTPSIMLEYRPKCLDFMMSMGLEKFNMRTDNLSLDLIIDNINELYDNTEIIQKKIFDRVSYYKDIQRKRSNFISAAINV